MKVTFTVHADCQLRH